MQAADDPDWSEVNVESTNLEGDDWYGRTELVNLQPDSEYRVRVASENAEGSSQFSDVVNFFTTPAGTFFKMFVINLFNLPFRVSNERSNFIWSFRGKIPILPDTMFILDYIIVIHENTH